MARGRLRIYVGAATGVGTTYAMLCEAHRRIERGTDVVCGLVQTHGRARTAALLQGLPVVPCREVSYRGTTITEPDVDAILARRPHTVLVDELAHTNAPGSRNVTRWQDVLEILEAGISVISTVTVQQLESVTDVVRRITGVTERDTVPDRIVRDADQLELVDMEPEALRRRMAHGNIYPPERIDAALANYFRIENLTALRELALLWLAGRVDDQLEVHQAGHGDTTLREVRERVVVALTGGDEGDRLIRRASRIATRTRGTDLLAVHVTRSDGLTSANPANLVRQRTLTESLGGTYHQVVGDDVPRALLDFARAVNATQLVLGTSRRGRVAGLLSRGVAARTTALSGPIDIHLVTHEQAHRGRRRARPPSGLTLRRRVAGLMLTAAGLPAATELLANLRHQLMLPSQILVFLVLVVAVALVGGAYPAVLAAVSGFLLLNYFFTSPVHTFTIDKRDDLLALVVFVLVAAAVSAVVDLAARRTVQASRAGADALVLSTLADSVLRGEHAVHELLERLRETFSLASVSLLEPAPDRPSWRIVATVGGPPSTRPDDADLDVTADQDLVLALRGGTVPANHQVLEAFAAQVALALRHERLTAEAAQAQHLEAADRMRTALLAAVSHELRTPLASATAAIDSLRSSDIAWTRAERAELLATAGESLARLDRLVANLLDMSRLQAGALGVSARPFGIDEAVAPAVHDIVEATDRVRIQIPDDLPEVVADPALTERILANLIGNALRYSPTDQPVLISGSALADRVELRVIDRGPGIAPVDRDRVFLPFQRLGDRNTSHGGVGLGLALSRGLAEAMSGSLAADETPGGGLTMILSLPTAASKRLTEHTS